MSWIVRENDFAQSVVTLVEAQVLSAMRQRKFVSRIVQIFIFSFIFVVSVATNFERPVGSIDLVCPSQHRSFSNRLERREETSAFT